MTNLFKLISKCPILNFFPYSFTFFVHKCPPMPCTWLEPWFEPFHCAGSSPVEETGHHYPNGGHHIQPRIFHPTHPVQAFHQGKIFYMNIRDPLLTLSVFDQRCFIGSRTFPNWDLSQIFCISY